MPWAWMARPWYHHEPFFKTRLDPPYAAKRRQTGLFAAVRRLDKRLLHKAPGSPAEHDDELTSPLTGEERATLLKLISKIDRFSPRGPIDGPSDFHRNEPRISSGARIGKRNHSEPVCGVDKPLLRKRHSRTTCPPPGASPPAAASVKTAAPNPKPQPGPRASAGRPPDSPSLIETVLRFRIGPPHCGLLRESARNLLRFRPYPHRRRK